MYFKTQVEGVARIPPNMFEKELSEAIVGQLKTDYEGEIIPELGMVIAVLSVEDVNEGVLIPGDGAAFYRCKFTVIHYGPEINELIEGEIKDIAKFGAFIDFGPFEGMVHISQTMDDFVSFNKAGSLAGRESKKVLKVGDLVRARIVAISFKDPRGPKIGLTMRQPYLGKLEWIDAQINAEKKLAKKAKAQADKSAEKKGAKKKK